MGAPTVKICVINCHNEQSLGQFSFFPGFTISSMAFYNLPDDDIDKYGNRTEWSTIRSVIIRVIAKSDDRTAGVQFVDHEYDYRPNWTTRRKADSYKLFKKQILDTDLAGRYMS